MLNTHTMLLNWSVRVDTAIAAGTTRRELAKMCGCSVRLVSSKTWAARPILTARRPHQTEKAVLRALGNLDAHVTTPAAPTSADMLCAAWAAGVGAAIDSGVTKAQFARMCECGRRLVSTEAREGSTSKTTKAIRRAVTKLENLRYYPEFAVVVESVLQAISEYQPAGSPKVPQPVELLEKHGRLANNIAGAK